MEPSKRTVSQRTYKAGGTYLLPHKTALSGMDMPILAIVIPSLKRYSLMDKKLWEKELWTQQEVSDYFRVVPGTVKNWRDQGLLSYWQAPGSILFQR